MCALNYLNEVSDEQGSAVSNLVPLETQKGDRRVAGILQREKTK
jgi:hypothetical protein